MMLTPERAAHILARHYVQSRPSDRPDCIDALSVMVTPAGIETAWEAVPRTIPALRDWLGY